MAGRDTLALIKEDFPEIKGLESTLSSYRSHGGFQPAEEGSVIQIHHCGGDMQHWITTCSIDGKVLLYDSLPMKTLPDEIQSKSLLCMAKIQPL